MSKKFYMRSGVIVDFGLDKITHVPLEDILFSLSREFRFHGQSDCSVLLHSIVCGTVASRMGYNELLVQHAYLHDFPEAFIRDVPSMIKTKEYIELEDEIYTKLLSFMNIPKLSGDDKDILRQVDLHARLVEAYFMFDDIGLYEAILDDVHVDPQMLMTTTVAWQDVAQVGVFTEEGEIQPQVVAVFKNIFGRF